MTAAKSHSAPLFQIIVIITSSQADNSIFFIVSSPFFTCPIIIAYSQQQNSRKLLLYYEFFVKFYEYGKKMVYKYLKIYRYISDNICSRKRKIIDMSVTER